MLLNKTEGNLKEKELPPKLSANFPGLIDVVWDEGQVKFLMEDGSLETDVEVDGILTKTPPKDKLGFSLPNYENILRHKNLHTTDVSDVKDVSDHVSECLEDTKLLEELIEYHKESAELPDERLYILIAAWDFHTHMQERAEYSPIIFFAGLPEKGKSRMAKSMVYVCRRGIIKASVTDAQLIREASDHGATLFFDMTDFEKSMERSGSMDVILSRFERGLKVGRVNDHKRGAFQDMTYYDVFGPTIIGSNATINNILGSRTISIVMKQSKRKFPKAVDIEKGHELRERLIAWRLAHRNDNWEIMEKPIGGRFGDITACLTDVLKSVNAKYLDLYILLVEELNKKRNIAKADSLEGEVILAILQLEVKVDKGVLPVKDITDKINQEKSDRERFTYQKIGRKLDIMGYQKARTGSGASAIEWNPVLNESLASEHNVDYDSLMSSETSNTPETPETKEEFLNEIEEQLKGVI